MRQARQPLPLRGAAINVDVDSLHLYYRIHGLDPSQATEVVWERGVIRFAELFESLDIRATFFVVAEDLERDTGIRQIAQDLLKAGHELGSHSLTHPYDLVRLHEKGMREELARSFDILSDLIGAPVTGFRAPGYTMTPRLFELLEDVGYRYDSSVFPCPPYYLAKLGVLAKMALRRKRSQSIVGPPSVMWESTQPWQRSGFVEFPVSVLPYTRFPFIGTSLLMAGDRGYGLMRPFVKRLPFVNFELHGIDLCDLERDGIDPALLRQPDLRVPLEQKLALFSRVFSELRDGWGVAPLADYVPPFK